MNDERIKRRHNRIPLLILSAFLLFSFVSILIGFQLKHERNKRIPLNYLSEPVRNDQTWDSIDI